MKIIISPSFIRSLKGDLRSSLPDIKSSHRVEAIARGLGWATNAAMQARLATGAIEREPSSDAFAAYLAQHGTAVQPRALSHAIGRVSVRVVLTAHESLTPHGFGIYRGDRLSVVEWHQRYAEARSKMLSPECIEQFERAIEYLSCLDTTKGLNRKVTSYNLKHSAERWHDGRGIEGRWDREYVSNGMLIAAAHHLGLQVKRVSPGSFTANLNVSSRSIQALEDERKPVPPQPDAGQLFRVLGNNSGKVFYVLTDEDRMITLRADAHTPANLLRLAPVAYWSERFPPLTRRAAFELVGRRCLSLPSGIRCGDYFGRGSVSAVAYLTKLGSRRGLSFQAATLRR